MSRTKASFSHLLLSLFEGSLARKLRFHIFHLQIFREISHKSFVFTSLTVGIWKVAHCNGCVKVTWRGGRVRNTIVFCTWTSYIVLEWLHQRCDSDLSADFLSLKAGCVWKLLYVKASACKSSCVNASLCYSGMLKSCLKFGNHRK